MEYPPLRDNKKPMLIFLKGQKIFIYWWDDTYVEQYIWEGGEGYKQINIYFNQTKYEHP